MLSGSLGRGFQLGTLFRATSATPYTITAGADLNRDTILNDRPAGIGRNSARGSGLIDLGARLSWSHGIGTRKGPAEPTRSLVRIGGDSPNIPDFGNGAKPDAPQLLAAVRQCHCRTARKAIRTRSETQFLN